MLILPSTAVRLTNIERRNQRLRDTFYERYTKLPRPKKVSREYVVHQLAEEYFLSVKTVERVLYTSG